MISARIRKTLLWEGLAMLDRTEAEALVYKIAVAALSYYPGKTEEEPGYTIDEDIDWCLGGFHGPSGEGMRDRIRELIIDPTSHRSDFVRDVMGLVAD